MFVKYIPQLNDTEYIEYSFLGDAVTAKCNDVKDTFDFTGLPDGKVDPWDVESALPYDVIISAKRENGILYVELLNFVKIDATEKELFPEWIEVVSNGEYKLENQGTN